MRIALFGNFGTANLGNEGTLSAFLQLLTRVAPDAQIECLCADEIAVTREHGVASWTLRPSNSPAAGSGARRVIRRVAMRGYEFRRALQLVAEFDLIIVPGTGILDDYGERPLGMPWICLEWALAARLRGVPLALVSIGAGPIVHPASRFLMISMAKLAAWRSYRDQRSKEFLQAAGVDTSRDAVTPDLAFALAKPETSLRDPKQPLTLGVGVMEYRGWDGMDRRLYESMIAKLAEFIVAQLRAGRRVRLLIGQATDDGAVRDALQAIRAIDPRLAEQVSYEPAASLLELMVQMTGVDVVVASRFHLVVCALKLAKPTVSLGYAKKNDVLLADVGLAEFAGDLNDFTLEWLTERVERAIERSVELANRVRGRVSEYEAALSRQEARLRAELFDPATARAGARVREPA